MMWLSLWLLKCMTWLLLVNKQIKLYVFIYQTSISATAWTKNLIKLYIPVSWRYKNKALTKIRNHRHTYKGCHNFSAQSQWGQIPSSTCIWQMLTHKMHGKVSTHLLFMSVLIFVVGFFIGVFSQFNYITVKVWQLNNVNDLHNINAATQQQIILQVTNYMWMFYGHNQCTYET
jgi:hypothetical protein